MESEARVLGRGQSGSRKEAARVKAKEVELDEKPRSVYELMTRTMLEELREDMSEVKGRVNTLLWLVIGALLVELLMRVVK
jgi:hypothetical protein